ncbi:MAG: carbohydrate-binding protein [Nonomuraea sp.]|nr:carbohydrate-binding protein [Nonomuraea sp.]
MNEPFRDPELPLADRIADLRARLTVSEKIALLHQYQPAVERLGLAAFTTGTEALHGLAWRGVATVFPQAIGLASTWDPELVRQVGAATGDEVVAFHRKEGVSRNVWAPVVNLLRDPRWGRNEEGYSEDPWLTGLLATAFSHGLRGSDPMILKTAPALKHFLAYNNETDRCVTSSNLPPRVLREYELPAFLPALEAGAAVAVMPSYNLVNGRPAHLSPLIEDVLRAVTPGLLVVSDAYAPGNLTGVQGYHDDPAAAHAHAIRAGLDSFTQDDDRSEATLGHIRAALERGLLTEDELDRAVGHVLSVRFRLGEFDPGTPYDEITEEVVNCPEHQRLAREAARRSLVLLRNDGLLPLSGVRRVAVIGQLGDALMEDWYSGTLPYSVTARAGLAGRCETLFCEGVDRVRLVNEQDGGTLGTFDLFDWGGGAHAFRAVETGLFLAVEDGVLVDDQPGPSGWEVRQTFRLEVRPRGTVALRHISTGGYVGADGQLVDDADSAAWLTVEVVTSGTGQAAALAADADVAVVVVGDHPLVNGRETEDRADLALAPAQDALVAAVLAANPRTVMVISSGYPVTWTTPDVPAVLWSAHGGQEYGHALADVLLGDADPEGRLTQTWYRSACELPDLLDYDIITSDATYQYFRGTPLFPFGHGLSYTTFDHSDLRVALDGDTVTATMSVRNTGAREGVEVVQLYTHQQLSRLKQPLRRLRTFQKVRLAPGESRSLTFRVPVAELASWDVTRGRFVVESAPHQIMVGSSATDLRLSATLQIPGEDIPPRSGSLAATSFDEYDAVDLVDAARERGDAVRSQAPGAWLLFRRTDLTGMRTWQACATSTDGGLITLRLGDPIFGEVLGELAIPAGGRYDLRPVSSALAAPDGVHDVGVVFENEGITLSRLSFA